jgi:hypothetical protein
MSIEMNMNYEIIEEPSMDAEYGDEIMSTGWNPAVDLIGQQQLHPQSTEQVAMPADLTTEIIDVFLRKMYSMQR